MSDEHSTYLPRLTSIDEVIAEDWWEYAGPEGATRMDHLRIGKPKAMEKSDAWYCPVQIQGHQKISSNGIVAIVGCGPVDALMNAMGFVRILYAEREFGPRGGVPPAS
jgi:hypothetical protein